MIPKAEEWAEELIVNNRRLQGRPLAGIPVSLKDTIPVGGFGTSVGYSAWTGHAAAEDGALVKILKDAGQILSPGS